MAFTRAMFVDMSVKGVVACVYLSAGKPPIIGGVAVIQYFIPLFMPEDISSCFRPKCLWVFLGMKVGLIVLTHCILPLTRLEPVCFLTPSLDSFQGDYTHWLHSLVNDGTDKYSQKNCPEVGRAVLIIVIFSSLSLLAKQTQ